MDLLCEETVHEQESFRTWTVKASWADTVFTAMGSISQQDVHSSLPLFHKFLREESMSLLEKALYQEFGWVGERRRVVKG